MSYARLLKTFLLPAFMGALLPAMAQTPAAAGMAVPATSEREPAARPSDRRIERIQHEDAGSRIDELRVGGETQSITVSPKGGMPAYEVIPATGNRGPATAERGNGGASGGTRVWNIISF